MSTGREEGNDGSKSYSVTFLVLLFLLIAVPPVIFYTVLLRHAVNIPLKDDYQAILDFVNHMVVLRHGRLSFLLTLQFNGYRLVFERLIVWLQLSLFHVIDFKALCGLGDAFVLPLAFCLWKMFLPAEKGFVTRLVFFLPVPWLLFQLQYIETLNWAMASLQNLPVLVFSLAAIYLLTLGTRRTLAGAVLFLLAAVSSSPNGLFVIPIGILILGQAGRRGGALFWVFVGACCVGAYAYRYDFSPPQVWGPVPIVTPSLGQKLLFAISFLGNASEFPVIGGFLAIGVLLCPLLGLALCAFFAHAALKGHLRGNPAVFYSVLFLLITAAGVASMRSQLGFRSSLSSRYGMYSILLVIFAWFTVAERLPRAGGGFTVRNRTLQRVTVVAIVFSVVMDIGGYQYIVKRNRALTEGMSRFQNSDSHLEPAPPSSNQQEKPPLFWDYVKSVLRDSKRLGTYYPPGDLK